MFYLFIIFNIVGNDNDYFYIQIFFITIFITLDLFYFCFFNSSDCSDREWGVDCSKRCSSGCVDDSCDRVNGSCKCYSGFGGEMCDKGREAHSVVFYQHGE